MKRKTQLSRLHTNNMEADCYKIGSLATSYKQKREYRGFLFWILLSFSPHGHWNQAVITWAFESWLLFPSIRWKFNKYCYQEEYRGFLENTDWSIYYCWGTSFLAQAHDAFFCRKEEKQIASLFSNITVMVMWIRQSKNTSSLLEKWLLHMLVHFKWIARLNGIAFKDLSFLGRSNNYSVY